MTRKKINANVIFSILVLFVIALFVIKPKVGMSACYDGLKVWATALLPALFPFFVLTSFLTSLKTVEALSKKISKVTGFLFGCPGISSYIYLMSIISGYPVGAKITADLYEQGGLTRKEAIKITTFTSTSGPLFIIGTVGIAMFNSFKLGLIILISHFVGAILNGILFRSYGNKKSPDYTNVKTTSIDLSNIMLSSIKSILIIGGYVALFFVLIALLENYHILSPLNYVLGKILSFCSIDSITVASITSGLLEVTKGCLMLSGCNLPLQVSAIFATFMISFGGLCIHAQAITFLKKFDMSYKLFVLIKFCHAVLSSLICALLAILCL